MSIFDITCGTGAITIGRHGDTTMNTHTNINTNTIYIGRPSQNMRSDAYASEFMNPSGRIFSKMALHYLTRLHKDVCGIIAQMLDPSARYMLARVFNVTPLLTRATRMCILRWDRPEMYASTHTLDEFTDAECRLADVVNMPTHEALYITGPRTMCKLMTTVHAHNVLESAIELGCDDVFDCMQRGTIPPVLEWNLSDAITMRLLNLPSCVSDHNRNKIIAAGTPAGVFALEHSNERSRDDAIVTASGHVETLKVAYSKWPDDVRRLHHSGRLYANADVATLEWAHANVSCYWKEIQASSDNYDSFVWLCEHGAKIHKYMSSLQHRLYLHIHGYISYKIDIVTADADMDLYPMILEAFGSRAHEIEHAPFRVWLYLHHSVVSTLQHIINVDSCLALRKYMSSHAITSADVIDMISAQAVRCLRECRSIIANMPLNVKNIIITQLRMHPNPCVQDVALTL